jgi:hypothetical protein
VEVTCRSLHSRLLFCPRPLMNEIILGTHARAKQRHKVRVCFFVCNSNHMHLPLWTEDARELSRFMGYFLSKLAREVGRLTGWKEKIFGRRYQSIVVSDEEEAQIARLRYGLAHGAKEDLVDRPVRLGGTCPPRTCSASTCFRAHLVCSPGLFCSPKGRYGTELTVMSSN